jgi:hypothetical protein
MPGGIGNTLLRQFTLYNPQPLTTTSATSDGLTNHNSYTCIPNLGIPYSVIDQNSFDRRWGDDYSTTLYYTPSGQLSGLSIELYGVMPRPLSLGWYDVINKDRDHYRISLSFRDGDKICDDTNTFEEDVGD